MCERGESVAVGVVNLCVGERSPRSKARFDQLVSGGNDGDPGLLEDVKLCAAAGGGDGDFCSADAAANGQHNIAGAGLRAARDDMLTAAHAAICSEAKSFAFDRDVLQHDHGV